jgi:hypothetical protein
MARYIDADKLIEALQTDFEKEGAKADDMAMSGNADLCVKYSHGQFCYLNAIERIKNVPTADVVPKSEYDEVLSSWQKIHDSYDADCIEHYKYGRAEVAREMFAEIERLITKECLVFKDENGIRGYVDASVHYAIAELKKKYIGDKQRKEDEGK